VVRVLGFGAQPLDVLKQQRRRGHILEQVAVVLEMQPQPLNGLTHEQFGG
jgi:hypothetical protein